MFSPVVECSLKNMSRLTFIPAVDLDATAALYQRADVGICGGAAVELVFLQVGVVARVDEVVGQRLVHVLGEGRRGRERRRGGEGRERGGDSKRGGERRQRGGEGEGEGEAEGQLNNC